MLDTIGNRISDRYKLVKQLRNKAGRSTYLAEDIQANRQVIIKILQFDNLFKWDDLKLFEREAKTLKNLDHPAIPKYLDYFEVDNDLFCGFALVQTYIDAPNLEDLIQQGRKFTEAELIELAQKLLEILDYLHSYHPPVIHRDIKPSNILISSRTGNSIGELYLVDFGSVQTAASKEEGTITIVGSYGYIPLEQFGGQTTTASDLYSLGMTLIYVITGVHPAELPQHNGRVRFSNSQIGSGLQRWLLKITEPYLDKRFDSVKSAQAGLLSSKQIPQSFSNLRPCNSKIQINHYQNILEISFPKNRTIKSKLSDKDKLIIFRLSVAFIAYSYVFSIPAWFIHTLFIIAFLAKIYFELIFFHLDQANNKRHKIYISKDKDIQSTNYSNQKSNPSKQSHKISANESILVIDCFSGVSNVSFNIGSCQISLFTDNKEYIIGDHRCSQEELWWLGKEISNFLDLELQFIATPA